MTLRQWLAIERRPEMCGINARACLKALGGRRTTGRAIHRAIALNAIRTAANRLAAAIKESR